MSDIDWSKAPEGATHWGPETGDYVEAFYRKDGDYWFFAAVHTHWLWESFKGKRAPNRDRLRMLVERPASWNGEGLPPVGVICEVLWDSTTAEYVMVKIVGHDEAGAVYRYVTGERKGQYHAEWDFKVASLPNFRPIRTAEQIAAEEREKEIIAIYDVIKKAHFELPNTDVPPADKAKEYAAALHAAGYRKVEVKP